MSSLEPYNTRQDKTRRDESSMRGRVGMYGGSGTAASSTPYIRFHVHSPSAPWDGQRSSLDSRTAKDPHDDLYIYQGAEASQNHRWWYITREACGYIRSWWILPSHMRVDTKLMNGTIDYKVSTFLLLHSDFWYNSINGMPESLIASWCGCEDADLSSKG